MYLSYRCYVYMCMCPHFVHCCSIFSCSHAVDGAPGRAAVPRLQYLRLPSRGLHGGRPKAVPQAVCQVLQVSQGAQPRHHQRAPESAVLQGLLRCHLYAAGVQHRQLRRHRDAGRYSATRGGGATAGGEGGARQAGATLPRLRYEGNREGWIDHELYRIISCCSKICK